MSEEEIRAKITTNVASLGELPAGMHPEEPARKIAVLDEINSEKLAAWLVLSEKPVSGYRIIFVPGLNRYGLAVEAKAGLVLTGLYGSLEETVRAL